MTAVTVHVAEPRWSTPHDRVAAALTAHLAPAVVTARFGVDPREPRALTLTVTGATPDDVDHAADLYLASAGLTYQIGSAA